jgi:hypothetical protein
MPVLLWQLLPGKEHRGMPLAAIGNTQTELETSFMYLMPGSRDLAGECLPAHGVDPKA